MANKKLLLTIKDLKDLGLLTRKSKKRKKKRRYNKKMLLTETMGGLKSDSSHLTGFGTQINRGNDLQNESIRLQNDKLLENNKQNGNQNKLLLELTNEHDKTKGDLHDFKQQAAHYADYLQKTLLLRSDAVDVPAAGGSKYFDVMGDPNKLVDHHPNENKDMYDEYKGPSMNFFEINPKVEQAKKHISQMNTDQLTTTYLELGGQSDISGLTRKEKYAMVKNLANSLKAPKVAYSKKSKK